jgi:hypothetical protein
MSFNPQFQMTPIPHQAKLREHFGTAPVQDCYWNLYCCEITREECQSESPGLLDLPLPYSMEMIYSPTSFADKIANTYHQLLKYQTLINKKGDSNMEFYPENTYHVIYLSQDVNGVYKLTAKPLTCRDSTWCVDYNSAVDACKKLNITNKYWLVQLRGYMSNETVDEYKKKDEDE